MKSKFFSYVVFILLVTVLNNCKKDALGPTDIRIINKSVFTYEDVFVDTSFGTNQYGNVAPGGTTDYKRFEKAYREANIKLEINGEEYEFIPVNYTYEIPLGRGKFTYEISADTTAKALTIHVTADAPL